MSKKPTTDLQLNRAARGVNNFRGVFMIDELPIKPWVNESAIVNLNNSSQTGSHWVCYVKQGNAVQYFDSFGGVPPPPELVDYLGTSRVSYNSLRHQTFNQQNCGQLCVQFLLDRLWNNTHRLICTRFNTCSDCVQTRVQRVFRLCSNTCLTRVQPFRLCSNTCLTHVHVFRSCSNTCLTRVYVFRSCSNTCLTRVHVFRTCSTSVQDVFNLCF